MRQIRIFISQLMTCISGYVQGVGKHISKNNTSSYLAEGRLAEVLALIQVLAYDRNTSRSEEGLIDELKSKPDSANSWVDLGKSHPEFFRVRYEDDENEGSKVNRVSLIARYVLPHESIKGKKIRPQLEPGIVNKIMEIAIEIHDRQENRSERWKIVIPMIVAIVSAAASIVAALIRSGT